MMEEQTKIDNYLHTIEDHIMTNQITPQEFMVYYQNIKTLIISDKLSKYSTSSMLSKSNI